MIQRRAARFVMARYGQRDSVTEMLEELSWDTLEQRRLKARIIMGYRITAQAGDDSIWATQAIKRHQQRTRHEIHSNRNKQKLLQTLLFSWNDSPMELPSSDNSISYKHRGLQRQVICCPHQTSLLAASYTNILTRFYLVYLSTLFLLLYSFSSFSILNTLLIHDLVPAIMA